MNAIARSLVVAAVVALATLGEGGAQPWSLVAQHVLLAAAVAACALRVPPGRCISAGWKCHSQMLIVLSGASGHNVCTSM